MIHQKYENVNLISAHCVLLSVSLQPLIPTLTQETTEIKRN